MDHHFRAFSFVDRITVIEPGVRIAGSYTIPAGLAEVPMSLVAEATLAALWRRRNDRQPVLIVIDEAHNVCPAAPEDLVTALTTEHAVRIAGEGRKFGLYLLVATPWLLLVAR